jgi:signal transduction histidine kinase
MSSAASRPLTPPALSESSVVPAPPLRHHTALLVSLAAHLPLLVGVALASGQFSDLQLGLGFVFPVALILIIATVARRKRSSAFLVIAGLLMCSVLLADATDGLPQAHFHALLVVAASALYQDRPLFYATSALVVLHLGSAPFLWSPVSHGVDALAGNPALWSVINVVAVGLLTALLAATIRQVERRTEAHNRMAYQLGDAAQKRRQALDLHDKVVQSLAAASYAQQLEQYDRSRQSIKQALAAARQLVSELMGDMPSEDVPLRLDRPTRLGRHDD